MSWWACSRSITRCSISPSLLRIIACLRGLGRIASPSALTLGARVQQLVHFGQLLALGRAYPARLHTCGALHAGAALANLVGVAESALLTSGRAAYALGIEIVAELQPADEGTARSESQLVLYGLIRLESA